jgi:hypothetical protein
MEPILAHDALGHGRFFAFAHVRVGVRAIAGAKPALDVVVVPVPIVAFGFGLGK